MWFALTSLNMMLLYTCRVVAGCDQSTGSAQHQIMMCSTHTLCWALDLVRTNEPPLSVAAKACGSITPSWRPSSQ